MGKHLRGLSALRFRSKEMLLPTVVQLSETESVQMELLLDSNL